MNNIYEECPKYENAVISLRQVAKEDAKDLLFCYGDKKAVPFFNSDNCHGDDFYYPTIEKMNAAIDFWKYSYENKYFVRWTVIYSVTKEIIGTIEMFHRTSDDSFNHVGVLRMDLRSSFENEKIFVNILKIVNEYFYDAFDTDKIITKAIPTARQRIKALLKCGYTKSDEHLIGHDGTEYGDYYIRNR